AHWVRFVVGGDEILALGLDHYLLMGLTIGAITAGLLALHGLYDEERRPGWPKRLNAIVSAVSTALILAIALWFFFGDQSFSRVWFGTGWGLTIVALALWRTLAEAVYERLNAAFAPLSRVVIVGANPLGRQLSGELAEHFEVVGYVDNG